jgi:hypothetical protein
VKAKDIVIIVLLLALAVLSYVLGYRSGLLRDAQIRQARGRLNWNLTLYEKAERGDLRALTNHLGMIILGQTREFEKEFGVPTGTNYFVERFSKPQGIAARVESTLVPIGSILTNFPHTPDAKVTVEGR